MDAQVLVIIVAKVVVMHALTHVFRLVVVLMQCVINE